MSDVKYKFDGRDSVGDFPYSGKPQKSGCFTPAWVWFVVFLVVAAVGVAVGVGVYYLHPDKGARDVDSSTSTTGSPTPDLTTSLPGLTTTPGPVDIRLPSSLSADHYNVRIRPDIYSNNPDNFKFNGTVDIYFTVMEPTDKITFHFNWIEITHYEVHTLEGMQLEVMNVSADVEKMFGVLHMRDYLAEGSSIIVKVDYNGYIYDDLTGIYYASYDNNGETVYILTSMLHPIHARKVFPCLDEPARKATFNVTIERKNHFTSMFNTIITQSEELEGDWIADHYLITPKMSTYLLAFLVSDFTCQNTSSKFNTHIDVCSRPNALDQTDFALSLVDDLQTWLEEYFNIKYPLPRMVHAAVPNFAAGAMENWGLVFYRETNLLYDSSTSSAASKQRVPAVTAHELAHQWFGNLVTPGWWDDTWLNEGFASWMEVPCADSVLPDWKLESQFVASEMQVVMRTDGLASSHPVYQPINSPQEIDAIFDSITYSKGAAVVRMMYYFLGNSVFQQGLTNYLNERSYDEAHHDDLFLALTQEAVKQGENINVTEIMYPWIRQMGYPTVHHSYDKTTGKVSLTQQHFLLDPTETPTPSPYNYTWHVPISVVTNLDTSWDSTDNSWLTTKSGEISNLVSNAEWILGNPGERYFYRVNYDNEMWDSLIQQLNTNHMAILLSESRAQLIDDAFNLGRSNAIDQTIGMKCTEYLDKEDEFVPWISANINLAYVAKMLMLSPNYGFLQRYMEQKAGPQHDALGWNDDPENDPHIEQRRRSLILDIACRYQVQRCLDNATIAFNQWEVAYGAGDNNPISLNLRNSAYCYGVANGASEEWLFVQARYKESNSGGERSAFLQAMACTREPYLLNGYLDLALKGVEIATQDFSNVIVYVSRNPVGRDIAWNFFRANWVEIERLFGGVLFAMPRMVSGITDSFSTAWKLQELERFMTEVSDLGSAKWAFEQAVESTKINIAWRAANEETISNWLYTKVMNSNI